MTNQKIVDYVINTPNNTNPVILKQMLKDVAGSGNLQLDTTLTIAGAAADAKAVGDAISKLSGGNADQTSPESYGAVGDGVTDDAEAITQALAASTNVVFDGDKTYAVGSTIVIPADSMVDFRGATVVPTGNHDVIQVKPGSLIENLVVRCTDVAGWDSSAVVLYGGDEFIQTNPTTIRNVKLYCNTGSTAGLTTNGVGVKLYGDAFGDVVSGITADEILTYGFGIGMLFVGVGDEVENPTGGLVFIGANKFRGYWSHYDNVGIKMVGRRSNDHITNNIFTDLQIEPKNVPQAEKQSSYGIYCDGFTNYFEGCLYDYFNGHTAIYFTKNAGRNVVKTTDSQVHAPGFLQDFGVANTVTNYYNENLELTPYTAVTPKMVGNQDDCLAFIDRRADCTLESFDGEPVSGNLSYVFDPNPRDILRYRTINPEVNNRRARITINCRSIIRRLSNFYLQFYSAPKSVKITFYNDVDATVVYDTVSNTNRLISVCSPYSYGQNHEYNVAKIVIELGGFNSISEVGAETYGEWDIVRIMGVDSYKKGESLLWRDGGEMYGDIRFTQGNGIVLTATNGKKFLLSVSDTGTLSTSEYIEEEEEAPEVAVLIPTMLPGASWYNIESAGAEQSTVTSITFDSTYESTGLEDSSWACDEDKNGNIMAYRIGTDVIIKSTTGSDGVKLNTDSSYMFANDGTVAKFSSLASISGTETWRADRNTTVSNICRQNTILTNPICIPEGVTDMGRAFNGCYKLATPPVLPDGLVNMNTAFGDCIGLQYLPEIPNTVTNLNYAFQTCSAATRLPSEVPASVTSMPNAFRNCAKASGTIEINAVTVNDYTACFENTARDSDGLILTGSCPVLAQMAATNTQGKVTVAT